MYSIFIKVWVEIRAWLVSLDPFVIKSTEQSAGLLISDNVSKKDQHFTVEKRSTMDVSNSGF